MSRAVNVISLPTPCPLDQKCERQGSRQFDAVAEIQTGKTWMTIE